MEISIICTVLSIILLYCVNCLPIEKNNEFNDGYCAKKLGNQSTVLAENINLIFYNTSPDDYVAIPATRIERILDQKFYNASKSIAFLCAGQNTPFNGLEVSGVVQFFIKANIYNVIVIEDFVYTSNVNLTLRNIYSIGKVVGEQISKLINVYGIPEDKIELTGHSSGALIMAATAKNVQPQVGLLVGLDPFRQVGFFQRGYAKHTIAVRTDSGYNGDNLWNADTELIPNNGVPIQPGCPTPDPPGHDGCSHLIALNYWVYMLLNPEDFYGVECDEIKCNYSSIVHNLGPTMRKKGKFYFNTNSKPPYGLGIEGIMNIKPTNVSTLTYHDYIVGDTLITEDCGTDGINDNI